MVLGEHPTGYGRQQIGEWRPCGGDTLNRPRNALHCLWPGPRASRYRIWAFLCNFSPQGIGTRPGGVLGWGQVQAVASFVLFPRAGAERAGRR